MTDDQLSPGAIGALLREGRALTLAQLKAIGISPEDVDEKWMDEMVKRLFHEIRKQLSQLEAAKAESDTSADAARRAANARALAGLEKTMERLVRLEQQRAATLEMKVIGSNDEARLELERRLDQCLAARRALLPAPATEDRGDSSSS